MAGNIKLLITDFDGTLVDTFFANYHVYREVFSQYGICLSETAYKECFGLRFEAFMQKMGVLDPVVRSEIKELKMQYYPRYFSELIPNTYLIEFLKASKRSGINIAIASTARKENLMNVLNHLGINDIFDFILSGSDVSKGKPSPDIYLKALSMAQVDASQALVFEDSQVGIEAAENAGINYIKINTQFYGNRSKRSFRLQY